LDVGGNTITNAGVISSTNATGLAFVNAGNVVINHGRISGMTAISFAGAGFGNTLINTGIVVGGLDALIGAAAAEFVTNAGTMIGLVSRGGGADNFDGRTRHRDRRGLRRPRGGHAARGCEQR
jgi:hypothetical protein